MSLSKTGVQNSPSAVGVRKDNSNSASFPSIRFRPLQGCSETITWVYFLQARWKFPWRLHAFASSLKTSSRALSAAAPLRPPGLLSPFWLLVPSPLLFLSEASFRGVSSSAMSSDIGTCFGFPRQPVRAAIAVVVTCGRARHSSGDMWRCSRGSGGIGRCRAGEGKRSRGERDLVYSVYMTALAIPLPSLIYPSAFLPSFPPRLLPPFASALSVEMCRTLCETHSSIACEYFSLAMHNQTALSNCPFATKNSTQRERTCKTSRGVVC